MFEITNYPDRIKLISFLVSLGVLLTILTGIIIRAVSGNITIYVFAGLIFPVILVIPEIMRRNAMLPLFRGWNKLLKQYSLLLQWWVTRVSFYIIFVIVGMVGKPEQFNNKPGKTSMWKSRPTLKNSAYRSQYTISGSRKDSDHSWFKNYIHWCVTTKNKWMIFLYPFLLLLKSHRIEEEKDFPSNIYTLY